MFVTPANASVFVSMSVSFAFVVVSFVSIDDVSVSTACNVVSVARPILSTSKLISN